jgi:hypothetical protein
MNPIRVTIENIAPGDEIPDTDFKIRGHKISGRTLQLTLKGSAQVKIQALWDAVSEKLYLVGGSSVCDSEEHIGRSYMTTLSGGSFKVSIDLKPLGRKTCLKIFKMKPKISAGPDYTVFRDRQEMLLMSVNTRSKTVTPTYLRKKSARVHQIPLQRIEPGQEIPTMDFEILSYKIRRSTFMLFIADHTVDESIPPQIQAFWDETHQKLYLAGGKIEYLPGKMILLPKRRENWLHIDISPLGIEKKLKVFKMSDEQQEKRLLTCSVPNSHYYVTKPVRLKHTSSLGNYLKEAFDYMEIPE